MKMLSSLAVVVLSLVFLTTIHRINCLQCYICSCAVTPGETTCINDSELQCIIEYVEESYCYIGRSSDLLYFESSPNSDLIYLESLHYIQTKEEIIYSESSSSWQSPVISEFYYGCDWNLCNTPRMINFLPTGLLYTIDSNLLTSTLIPSSGESLTTCHTCTGCANSTGEVSCPTSACSGTCFIDGYYRDPQGNSGSCSYPFQSTCKAEKLNTAVQLMATYYIDDDIFSINDTDIFCKKTNCNNPNTAKAIQNNVTYSVQLNDQIYFRPNQGSTTSSPSNLLGCYKCNCQHQIGDDQCKILNCTIEYANQSFCEIVRDLKSFYDMEFITLGHVQSAYVPYRHFIRAEEEIILYKNLSWHPPSVSLIAYICDWPLCNDPRVVEKLTTSFQFNAEPSEIAEYLQSSEPLTSCLQCTLCTNSSIDFERCQPQPCPSSGYCYIEQYIDDPQFNDCEYAFEANCEDAAIDSSVVIAATYSIDDDQLDIEAVDVYCSKNDCNSPITVYALLDLIQEDIQLDPLFFFRPVTAETSTKPSGSSKSFISVSKFQTLCLFFISSIFTVVFY